MANITLNLTNLTSSLPSPISGSEGDVITVTLTPTTGYHLPSLIQFGSEITTKAYNKDTGVITFTMPASNSSITAEGLDGLSIALIGKETYTTQTNGIITAIGGIPSSLPSRYCQYIETDSNKIIIHNYGGTTPLQEISLSGLPVVPAGGNVYLHADASLQLEWVAGGGGTTVEANPTLAGTEGYLTGLKVGTTSYKIEDYEIVEITEAEYTAGSISSTKYAQLVSAKAIKGIYINGTYYSVVCPLSLKQGNTYIYSGHFNIDDAFFNVGVKVGSTYALSVSYTSGKLTELEKVDVEAVLDTSLLPDTYKWGASLTSAIFNKMKLGKVVLNIKLVQSAGGTPDYIGTLSDYYYITAWDGFGGNLIINKGVADSSKTNVTIIVTKDASSNVTLTAESESMFATLDDLKPAFIGNGYGTCNSVSATLGKDVTITDFKLKANGRVSIKFTNAVLANTTLNINSTGSKAIFYRGSAIVDGVIKADDIATFIYDGTNYVYVGKDIDNGSTPESLGFGYGICTTEQATTTKTATLSNYSLTVNGYVSIKFTYSVPASATLSINSQTAKPLFYKGVAITNGIIGAGNIATFVYDGTNYNLVAIDGVDISLLTSITYANLKTARDGGTLIKGQQYRITDYQCTTAQSDTQSANHPFDIIVVADDVNKLNENARAILHSGDTYFANSKLGAWELKYCLDNDTNRFAWASSSGKGVIFYMKDEFDNECPYDFKNIQFKRKLTDGAYDPTSGTDTWCYTFTWVDDANVVKDLSVIGHTLRNDEGESDGCRDNFIGECSEFSYPSSYEGTGLRFSLSNNCFISCYAYESGTFYGTYGIHLGTDCYSNTFGNYCYYNTFGDGCSYNTFGNNCCGNTFGNYCQSNAFGNYCNSNAFGNECNSNTFGNECYNNTFDNYCYNNTFGNNCYGNTFGNNCYGNTFGSDCSYNTFGDGCQYNKLVATGNTGYAKFNIFENGLQYVDLQADSASTSQYLQNITIRQGIVGASTLNPKVITETRNLAYDTTYRATGAQDKTA